MAIPSLFPDGDRIARLREPVGYWNALALLADAALALGLWVARSPRVAGRVAGLLLVYGAVLAVLLTQSRAGVVGALAVLALWLVLSDERLEDALRAVVAGLPAILVGGWAFTRPALVEDGALRADRVADGRAFAALTIAGAMLVALAAWRISARRLVERKGRPVRTALVVLCALAILVASVGLVAKVGNPYSWASSQLSRGECVNDPGRLTDLCANNRLQWWGEALDVAADRPVGGSGAGTFALARRRYRESATPVTEPHSVPLQLLADLGVVGLVLGLTVVGGAIVAARGGLRLVYGSDGGAAAALACLLLAFGTHALVDYDLDFVAVTAPALVALEARFRIVGPGGERIVNAADFFTLPKDNPARENVLKDDEVLASVTVPPAGAGTRSTYRKIMDREAWTHALVSAAVVLQMDGDVCREARIVLGGVAPVPWRAGEAEALLKGQRLTPKLCADAGEAAVAGARPLGKNGYKVAMTRALVARTLTELLR